MKGDGWTRSSTSQTLITTVVNQKHVVGVGIWNDDRGQSDIPAAHRRHSIYLPPCACQWWVSVESTMGMMEARLDLDLDLAGRSSAFLLQPKGRMSYAKLATVVDPTILVRSSKVLHAGHARFACKILLDRTRIVESTYLYPFIPLVLHLF